MSNRKTGESGGYYVLRMIDKIVLLKKKTKKPNISNITFKLSISAMHIQHNTRIEFSANKSSILETCSSPKAVKNNVVKPLL